MKNIPPTGITLNWRSIQKITAVGQECDFFSEENKRFYLLHRIKPEIQILVGIEDLNDLTELFTTITWPILMIMLYLLKI
jgi:hypothetical protein